MTDVKMRYIIADGDGNCLVSEDGYEYAFQSMEDAKERRDEIEEFLGGPMYIVKETCEFIREKDYWGWE